MQDWIKILLIVLVLLSVISPLLIFWAIYHIKEGKLRKLKINGRKIKATVVGFKQVPLFSYSGLNSSLYNTVMIKILAEAEIDGKKYKFESERIDQSKCKLEKEDTVTVLVMKGSPKYYCFDQQQAD